MLRPGHTAARLRLFGFLFLEVYGKPPVFRKNDCTMIESIHIEDISYFSENPEEAGSLSKINFVYGPNGSGKTTISRLIATGDRFRYCAVKWKN